MSQIELGNIAVDVRFKDIKNIHLSVYPPTGQVRISAPAHMNLETVRLYAVSKLDWIKAQQAKLAAQARETPREFLERESHYLWGKRYLLELRTTERPASIDVRPKKIIVSSPKAVSPDKLGERLDALYRSSLREKAEALIEKWEKRLDTQVNRLFIQKMKTKWGSCNHAARHVRLNLELAKKPPECLEYIVLHEMLHFFVQNHGPRFVELMDKHMPHWRQVRQTLNAAPLSHVDWGY